MIPYLAQSQLGFSLVGKNPSYYDWEGKKALNGVENANFKTMIAAYLDYEYQPSKDKNLLLLSQVGYNRSLSKIDYRNISMITFGLGIKFFPFHFIGDCDCPRFYQEGTWFSRGFFISATPKVSRFILDGLGATQGIGELELGIELPLNKKTALSPFLSLEFGSPVKNHLLIPSPTESSFTSIGLGIRIAGLKNN